MRGYIYALIAVLVPVGCFSRKLPEIPAVDPMRDHTANRAPSPDTVVYDWAIYFTWGGCAMLAAAVICGMFLNGSFASRFPVSLASGGVVFILLGYALGWIGAHPVLFSLIGVFILLVLFGSRVKKWAVKRYEELKK